MNKIKIFLGGYINFTNAQNLNCRALAEHLDENKFEVYTLELFSGSLKSIKKPNVHTFNCFKPHSFSKYFGYLWGIYHCDIAYLPKAEIDQWCKFWIKLFKRKSFRTVEGIYGKALLGQILKSGTSYKAFKRTFENHDGVFSITKHVKDFNLKHHGIESNEKILYLGTSCNIFLNKNKSISHLSNIVYIGRLIKRKGTFDVLNVAKHFPNIQFVLVGDGEDKKEVLQFIEKHRLNNVTLKGMLTHQELAGLLKKMDLHLFPSHSEGFPKVTLETAAAGVPSIVYADYGANEWITNGKNGFIVKDITEIIRVINDLQDHPDKLKKISKNAIEMANHFDWNIVVKEWEKVIIDIINNSK